MQLSLRSLSALLLLSFGFGTLFGYQLKNFRLKYLRRKRDRFARKLFDTELQLKNMIIVLHGGAAKVAALLIDDKMKAIKKAVTTGFAELANGKTSLDAVEAAVRYMEDDPHFNCGYGSSLTIDGTVEDDAIIMDGKTLKAGSVAAVTRIKHPISLARAVMERTDHCLIVSTGAEKLAKKWGFELITNQSLVHDFAQERLNEYKTFQRTISDDKPKITPKPTEQTNDQNKEHDTVGAVAIDKDGNVAVATSTGGLTAQCLGRVGDSPIIGAGGYADNSCGAVSTTGHGEAIMRTCLARHIMFDFINGKNSDGTPKTLQQSVDSSLDMMIERVDGYGGAIAVGSDGQIGIGFSTTMMPWAYMNSTDTQPTVHFGANRGEHFTEKL